MREILRQGTELTEIPMKTELTEIPVSRNHKTFGDRVPFLQQQTFLTDLGAGQLNGEESCHQLPGCRLPELECEVVITYADIPCKASRSVGHISYTQRSNSNRISMKSIVKKSFEVVKNNNNKIVILRGQWQALWTG